MVNSLKRINFDLFNQDLINSIKIHKPRPNKSVPENIRLIAQKIHTIASILAQIHIEFHYPIDAEQDTELIWMRVEPKTPQGRITWRLEYRNKNYIDHAVKISQNELIALEPHLEKFLIYVSEYLNNR